MIKSKSLQISAGEIRYLQSSPRDRDLVFIHGGFGDAGIISMLEKHFGREYRITAPYLPGHGSFDLGKNASYQDIVGAISEFLTKLELTDYVLMGHSLGGRLALDMALRGDLRAQSEILIAPMLFSITASLTQITANIMGDYVSDLGVSGRDSLRNETFYARFKNFQQIWRLVTSVGKVESITLPIPTTIIWGRGDSVLPLDMNLPIISRIKGAKLETYAGGHYWLFKDGSMEIIDRLITEK